MLRLFTYGMFVVGVSDGQDANVFTANWLTQVSFDPPMVAVSVENDTRSKRLIDASGRFAVSVLAVGQRQIAADLGRSSGQSPKKLEGVGHRFAANGCPVLEDALGYVACEVRGSVPAGDSTVYVGEVVEAASFRGGEPLTMKDAGFRHFG
ncbi:MAG TPA: flavin reductase family protein [Dehalococcoidia bacterium]|nr:flavin reductase family protein [Dehalococcoidia bacterium]